jgi:putative DNA primase/helicase
MSEIAIEAALQAENTRCDPPLSPDEIRAIAASVGRYAPAKRPALAGQVTTDSYESPPSSEPPPRFHLTDMGNCERLVQRYGGDFRYCPAWGKFLVWDGCRFRTDDTGAIDYLGKETVRGIYHEAGNEPDKTRRQALADHAKRSEAAFRLMAMVRLAQSEPGIPVRPENLDADPMLLNVLNGTLDLRTGELLAHDRKRLITKVGPVEYDPAAEAPAFMAFLKCIFDSRPGLIEFVQRAVGYSLTGSVAERVLFILYGLGRNGKTTLLEALMAALGDYAARTPADTLLAKRDGSIPNDVARLKGSRLAAASEADQNRRLAEATIKGLTGGDRLIARFMRGEWFEFQPTFKLWLATNHKPIIKGTDPAIWDRIRLIPFTVRIPEEEQDKALIDKLRAEGSGILRWAVEGCLAWQRDGLGMAEEVEAATVSYRLEQDVLGQFLTERCYEAADTWVSKDDLFQAYEKWCEGNREQAVGKREFGTRILERGIGERRTMATRLWQGIGLIDDTNDTNDTDDVDSRITNSFPPYKGVNPKTVSSCVMCHALDGEEREPGCDDDDPKWS